MLVSTSVVSTCTCSCSSLILFVIHLLLRRDFSFRSREIRVAILQIVFSRDQLSTGEFVFVAASTVGVRRDVVDILFAFLTHTNQQRSLLIVLRTIIPVRYAHYVPRRVHRTVYVLVPRRMRFYVRCVHLRPKVSHVHHIHQITVTFGSSSWTWSCTQANARLRVDPSAPHVQLLRKSHHVRLLLWRRAARHHDVHSLKKLKENVFHFLLHHDFLPSHNCNIYYCKNRTLTIIRTLA